MELYNPDVYKQQLIHLKSDNDLIGSVDGARISNALFWQPFLNCHSRR